MATIPDMGQEKAKHEEPILTVIIQQGDYKGEFILDSPIFKSFDDACDALKQFINSYSS